MPKVISFKCDGCGTEKQESNHWWKVVEKILDSGLKVLLIRPFDEEWTEKVYCGEGCAVKAVSSWMSKYHAPSA